MTRVARVMVDEGELVKRYLPLARIFFVRHGRGRDADDLAQEAMVLSLEALRGERVRDPARVGGFVLGVCRNLVRAHARRDDRRAEALARYLAGDPPPATEPLVDRFRLWHCVNELGARARDVVLRTFTADEDAESIAAALGTSAGGVRVLRHRALIALLECLERRGSP